jgi:hypothetical protein
MKNKLLVILALTLCSCGKESKDEAPNDVFAHARSISERHIPVITKLNSEEPTKIVKSTPKIKSPHHNVSTENSTTSKSSPLTQEKTNLLPVSNSEPAQSYPTEVTSKELIFNAYASYGSAFMSLSQQGAFGNVSGSSIAVNRTDFEVSAKLDDLSCNIEFSRYSLDMGNNTVNQNSKVNKNLNELSFKGGYKHLTLGARSKSSPFFRETSGTTLEWATLTSVSALIGYHLENEWTGPSLRPYRLYLDTEASFPFSGGSDPGTNVSSLSGYALRARARLEKTLFKGNGFNFLAGLDAQASYDHLQYNGSWGGFSGSIQRNLTEIQGSLGIRMEW